MWALDYQFDVTTAGRTIKILHVVNEHARESLADVVAWSIVTERGGTHPQFSRCDNGPELTANAWRTGAASAAHAPPPSIPALRGRTPGRRVLRKPHVRRAARHQHH